jgi:hypothetical protein
MAIVPIIKSLYPKVPAVAGVPNLLRGGAQIFDTLTLGIFGIGDKLNSLLGTPTTGWAIADKDGKKLADYDSVLAFDYQDNCAISDYPVERGSFASYNQVDQPASVRMVLSCSGSIERRNTFEYDLRNARRDLTLYSITTPEAAYRGYKLLSVAWTRTATNGAHRLEAHCEFREVREKEASQFSDPKIPSGATLKERGQLQPIPDTTIDTSGVV